MDRYFNVFMFWVVPITMVLGFILIFIVFIDIDIQNDRIRQSCKDIGMEYHVAMGTKFCVDTLGNAHYAKFNCKGTLWNKECTAQLISIGDVRVR